MGLTFHLQVGFKSSISWTWLGILAREQRQCYDAASLWYFLGLTRKAWRNICKCGKKPKERDHRKLGKAGSLHDFSKWVRFTFWLPNGATVRRELSAPSLIKRLASGYQHVYTRLWHRWSFIGLLATWEHYQEDMFLPWIWVMEKSLFCGRWTASPRPGLQTSCSLLPWVAIRIAEIGMMHRYKKSGALTGFAGFVKCPERWPLVL